MDINMHLETIRDVKRFIRGKDYEGLKEYIEKREQVVKETQKENKPSEYIENLVNTLK